MSIKPGFFFRGRIEHDPEGKFRILQPSSIGSSGEVTAEELPLVSDISPREYHVVDDRSVLFVAYGPRNRAYHFGHLPDNVVASSTFYLLRPRPRQLVLREEVVLPGYLAWYLNQPIAQAYFEALRGGVSVKMLRRDALGSLELPLPPLEVQEKVSEVARLSEVEHQLTRQLLKMRRLFTDTLLLERIHQP
ncbi:MAG: restriction endonuclease subunit S [Rhodothermales bacterium]